MFEKKYQKLSPRHVFFKRMLKNIIIGISIAAVSLCVGMFGYHHTENMSWVESYVNAAMILSGMGPVSNLQTNAGKIFAGTYALFSGIVFLIVIAVIFAPLIHRFLHRFHMEEEKNK